MIKTMTRIYYLLFIPAMITVLTLTSALAGSDPVPITADQAFDAAMTGIDPITGFNYGAGSVAIVDVRTPSEYQFQGTTGKVDNILLKGTTAPIVPDLGKVRLTQEGKYLEYTLGGKTEKTPIDMAVFIWPILRLSNNTKD